MKRTLYLLRHAEAAERQSGQQDEDRILTSKGLQNSTRMGMNFSKKNLNFDIIITSPAIRALSTSSLIAEQLRYSTSRIHQNPEIYEASTRTLLKVINQLKDEWTTVLIVGHNPTITYLAEYITHGEIGDMTTCGVVEITFEVDSWAEVSEGNGKLASYEYPDLLNF